MEPCLEDVKDSNFNWKKTQTVQENNANESQKNGIIQR